MDKFLYDESPTLLPSLIHHSDESMSYGSDDVSYLGEPDSPYHESVAFADDSSVGTRNSLEQQDAGFFLDFLPTGNTMPKPYSGDFDPSVIRPSSTFDMSGSPTLSSEPDSAEELWLQQFGESTSDSYWNLPSLPSHEEALPLGGTKPRRLKETSNKRKRDTISTSVNGKGSGGESKSPRPTQLRTASRAPKRYSKATAPKAAESNEDAKARAAHNQVEQQYRKRLNQQFERLLAVLPQLDDDEGMDYRYEESGSRGSLDKRMSKAEVLELARKRIKLLEKQNRDLMEGLVKLQNGRTTLLTEISPVKTEM